MKHGKEVTGHIRPRPNATDIRYFDAVIDFGKDELTGKRNRKTFRVDTTDEMHAKKELEIKKAEYLLGYALDPYNCKVGEYLDDYLETYVKVQSSPATVRDYRNTIEYYLKPSFGEIKLQKLTNLQIQRVYNEMRDKPKLLRAKTIAHINRVFKASLNVAVEQGYLKENPARKIKIGKDIDTNHVEVYSAEEIKELQACVQGTDMELVVALLVDCVMRRGELLGLKYTDIDFDKKVVHIQNALVQGDVGEKPYMKDCKTVSSNRKMVVSDYTIDLLKKAQLNYRKNRLKYGETFNDTGLVICQENGVPYQPTSMTQKWTRTLKKYELRHIKLHGMRHSAVSYLLAEGIPLHIVQQRAGHQDPKITLGVYSHVSKDKEAVVANKLDSELFILKAI